MAGTEVVATGFGAWLARVPGRLVAFYHDVMAELRRVTWPDRPQVQQLAIGVIVLSLSIGALIALMDLGLQQLLVRWIPALFAGRS
ncbi:MAG: preprotein translocase subunit SecE [Gemmatimonadetes bacterium]|nr:preprotein translocase subunit SecE [Gemmatimonadota bacterium]